MPVTKKTPSLLSAPEHGSDAISTREHKTAQTLAKSYKTYLSNSKTEREAVTNAVAMAEAAGFVPYCRGMALSAGDKVYAVNRSRALMLAVIGTEPLSEGFTLVASHVDSPRIDIKPTPLYEAEDMALLKTHYYGGVKKYQWTALPLELRGVVVKGDGTAVNVCIGADPADPILLVTDLLPHLAADQMKKTLGEAFTGESLNVLLSSTPEGGKDAKDRFKTRAMAWLHKKYGMTEADFVSAELMLVPAGPARDVGLDGSLIGGYGHDDRSCAFASVKALIDTPNPRRTALCFLADKEEIGSEGISGMQSAWFDAFVEDLCLSQGVRLAVCYENSFCLSADVCNALDPNFMEVSDKLNACRINRGLGIMKYTGRGGKGGSSDAPAEVMGYLRCLLNGGKVLWQTGELGKVDQGGGGTVAAYIARRNIAVVDAGVPVLSMHAPFECISKIDLYMAYKAMAVLFAKG
jgi:aspartyl aminopeptidase